MRNPRRAAPWSDGKDAAARKTSPTTARTRTPGIPVAVRPASIIEMMNAPKNAHDRARPPKIEVPPMNTDARRSEKALALRVEEIGGLQQQDRAKPASVPSR